MSDSPVQRWLDGFLRAYMALRPVDATFIGVHDHDHRLPDLSESGVGDRVAGMEGLLSRARRLGGERGTGDRSSTTPDPTPGFPLSPIGRTSGQRTPYAAIEPVEFRLATGFLRISLWEAESGHFHRGNPAYYTGEAVFGVLSLFLSDFAPAPRRVEAAIQRLEAVPRFLKQGRHWLGHGPGCHPEWTRRALRECEGALAFLGEGIDALAADLVQPGREGTTDGPGEAPRAPGAEGGATPAELVAALRRAASTAAQAFSDFHAWLANNGRAENWEVGCGPDILDLHIREGHFLAERAREIAGAAREEMEATRSWLEAHAGDHGARTPDEALAKLADRHPSPGEYLHRYREIWDSCREVAVREGLVTWPDFPIRYVPRPRWARAAAPYLYFLFYRSPAARHRPPVHDYLVAPLPTGSPDEVEAFLRAHHDGVIRANHVIHHGGLGHHVQNWHAFRAPSRIGRIAAVDGPARIALHCGGTMAEGWACYATDLMAELAEAGVEGGMTLLEAYAERAAKVRMCCRAIVDVELHTGGMELEQAVAFYREHAGMSEASARSEAVKNSMFPGMALMYHTGLREIHRVRDALTSRLGADFDLRAFHHRLLSWGSIPVTLAGDLTLEALAGERRQAAVLGEGPE